MTAPAAFSGDYVDLRFVKSRKVAQVIVEIPIEQATGFVASFGAPNPATGVPVALARLSTSPETTPKDKRRFAELPPAQQAAMRCNEPDFQRYMGATNPQDCAASVRVRCGVQSRSELNSNESAASRWRGIDDDYYVWQRGGIR